MIKAEVVDKSTTASDNKDEKTNNETVVVEPLTNSHNNNNNVQMPDIIPTSIELDSIQINNKIINKQNKVLFDLDKKQQDDNNNIRRISNASNVSSKRVITTYNNNNNNKKTSLDCHRKSTQVEINMDSIVVAKSATNSNNNRNPINNRLRNIIEILRNTFNTSNPSSSSNQTKKNNKSKQKSIQASNNQKQITAPTNTNNEIKSIINNNTKETKLNNMTDDDLSVCQLCFNICCMKNKEDGTNYMYDLDTCDHSFCIDCLRLYLKYQIIESRVSISCPQCSEKMHPNDIYRLLSLTNLITTIDNIPTDSLNYLNTITGMKTTTSLNNNNNTPSPLTTSSSSASSTSSSSEIQSTNKKLLPNSIDTASKTLSCSNENKQKKITDSNLSQIKPATPTTTRKQQKNQLPTLNLHEQQQNWPTLIQKYEEFMLRRVLVTIPDTRWCPAPDCTYAVIASGCANCPQLFCMRPECNTSFCYHCKQYWHPNLTCEDAAMRNNQSPIGILINLDNNNNNNNNGQTSTNKLIRSILQRSNSHISTGSSSMGGINTTTNGLSSTSAGPRIAGGVDLIKEEIKRCPKCQALIVKMDDGSCNHITCAVCGCEFCWLCMKEISDLHYLSPSGCTFWGKKPWSRKKKILWQLGILIGAPVGIALIAGVAVPAILIGLPIWSGRKVYVRYKTLGKHKRNLIVLGTVSGTVLVAPLVAALAVAIGVPILLAYVYGVVPISLCRSGGCGVTTNNNGGVRFAFDDETADNLNFFYNNTNNNEQNVNSNNNNNNNNTNNKKQINNTPTSVKVPISAIESKPDNILMVRSSPPSSLHVTTPHITMTTTNNNNNTAEDSITNSNDSNHLRPHTPVLVTITVANKSTKTLSNNSVLLSTNGSSGTNKHQKMKRIKSATSTSSSSILKESTEKKKTHHHHHHHHHHHKSSKTTSFTNKNVTSIATTCGSVELIKLNKTNTEFNLNSDNNNSTNINTTLNNKNQNEIKIKSIAAELVNETAPMSSITTPKCKLNNTTNTTSDLENNLSSSSSSHHLINESTCTNNNSNNKQQQQQQIENKENIYLNKITKSGSKNKQKKMNPSIGEVSIGAYTNTSMSADMMDDNGEEEDEDDEYDETNTNNKKYDELDDDVNSNFQLDQENSSTKAIASGSIKKYSIDQSNQLNSTTDIKMKLSKTDSKAVDTYSVSIISEKSINPSITAFAGSIKDNQSVENLNLVDDIISASVQTK